MKDHEYLKNIIHPDDFIASNDLPNAFCSIPLQKDSPIELKRENCEDSDCIFTLFMFQHNHTSENRNILCLLNVFADTVHSKKLDVDAALHTEKSFRNLIKSTRNQIVFTIFRLI